MHMNALRLRYFIPLFASLLLLAACGNTPAPAEQKNTTPQPPENQVTNDQGWASLFGPNLEKADYPSGIWSLKNGELTATEDQHIWTKQSYDNFELDLEFKTADGTNSGVIVYCSDVDDWIPNSVEIQIADDYNQQWAEADPSWRCGAIFGHQAANQPAVVKPPGEWNRYQIRCQDNLIAVILNGVELNKFDMTRFTSATTNPDGTDIPTWLSKPKAELPTRGHIGLQGKHAGAPVWFRNLRVREL